MVCEKALKSCWKGRQDDADGAGPHVRAKSVMGHGDQGHLDTYMNLLVLQEAKIENCVVRKDFGCWIGGKYAESAARS